MAPSRVAVSPRAAAPTLGSQHLLRVGCDVERAGLERVPGVNRRIPRRGGQSPGAAQPQVLTRYAAGSTARRSRRRVRPLAVGSAWPHLREPPPHDARAPPQPRPLPEVHHPAREQPRRRRYSGREGTGPRRAEQRRREEHERPGDADDSKAQLRGSMSAARARVQTPELVPQREDLIVWCAPLVHMLDSSPYGRPHPRPRPDGRAQPLRHLHGPFFAVALAESQVSRALLYTGVEPRGCGGGLLRAPHAARGAWGTSGSPPAPNASRPPCSFLWPSSHARLWLLGAPEDLSLLTLSMGLASATVALHALLQGQRPPHRRGSRCHSGLLLLGPLGIGFLLCAAAGDLVARRAGAHTVLEAPQARPSE